MNRINFFQPICSRKNPIESLEFSKTSFFDGYFSLSNKRYNVIKKIDGDSLYQIEKIYENQSFIVTTLKVISYFTFFIPLFMLTGKIIARSQYEFLLSNEQENMRISIDGFKINALEAYSNSPNINEEKLNLDFNEEQINDLRLAYLHRHHPSIEINGTRVYGGINTVCFFNSIPGLVFKSMNNKEAAEDYVKLNNQARSIINEHSLTLLQIPGTDIVEIDQAIFVVQERMNLMHGDFDFQRGLYEFCWKDEDLKVYIDAVFTQLLTFVIEMKFSDFKYDNIPLLTNGRVGLIDLDSKNINTGLFRGGAGRSDGLFNYLPLSKMQSFLGKAESAFDGIDDSRYNSAVEHVTKKEEKNRLHNEFIENQHELPEISKQDLKRVNWFYRKEAAEIVSDVNRTLRRQANNPSRTRARRVELNACKLTRDDKNAAKLYRKWQRALPKMHEAGLFSRYRMNNENQTVIIHC